MADVLDGLNQLTPDIIDREKRLADAVKVMREAPRQLLLTTCANRVQLHQQFWSNRDPQAVLNRMEPGEAHSLFKHDKDLAEFLAAKLTEAKVPAKTIATLVPGIPDDYDVAVDDDAKTVTIKTKG